jgi:anti-sigma-K factor RskA
VDTPRLTGIKDMSKYIRYQQPKICDHLAGQYVAGVMTERVRVRTESLAKKNPMLAAAIAYWSDAFVELQEPLNSSLIKESTSDQVNVRRVWSAIEQRISDAKVSKALKSSGTRSSVNDNEAASIIERFINSLFAWKIIAGGSALASVFMVSFLWLAMSHPEPVASAPSYLASMSDHSDPSIPPQFVLSAYTKNTGSPSRLTLQWVKNKKEKQHDALHLWAEDKETGELVYIGLQSLNNGSIELTKPLWDAIANSSRLLMTEDQQQPVEDNIVFSGLCLQLAQWQS